MRAPLSASFFLSWLATTAAAHADEPAPKAPSSEGAIPGQRGWIADGNLGVPILKSGEVKVVANGTLGYRWKKVEFITSAGANQYSSRSDNVFNDTVRTGVWLTLAYVTGEPGEPLRLLLLLDQSYAGYRTWYRRLPEAPAFDPKDPLTFDLSLEREVSHMLRSTMLFGLLLAPSDRAQARVVLGVGTQHEIFVRSTFEHADTGTEASLDVDASLTLRQLSRVAARYQLVPGALAVRLTSDATRFKLRRGSAAVKINLSSLAANTSVALFTFTQIEATNRLSFDVEKLGFLGLMPAASVGLDVSSLSGDVGKSTAVVPVFGLGLTNGRL